MHIYDIFTLHNAAQTLELVQWWYTKSVLGREERPEWATWTDLNSAMVMHGLYNPGEVVFTGGPEFKNMMNVMGGWAMDQVNSVMSSYPNKNERVEKLLRECTSDEADYGSVAKSVRSFINSINKGDMK